jgi:phage gpG-like protein
MPIYEFGKPFQQVRTDLLALRTRLPAIVGQEAVNLSGQAFRNQGWDGQPWPARKPGAPRNKGRALLRDTGLLRRSIRVVKMTPSEVTVGTDVPYARIHNAGGTINAAQRVPAHTRKAHARRTRFGKVQVAAHAVGAHTRRISIVMPKRQFLGTSPAFVRHIEQLVASELARIFS